MNAIRVIEPEVYDLIIDVSGLLFGLPYDRTLQRLCQKHTIIALAVVLVRLVPIIELVVLVVAVGCARYLTKYLIKVVIWAITRLEIDDLPRIKNRPLSKGQSNE